MMFWYDHEWSGWGYAGMFVGLILFWILILVGIIALIRFSSGTVHTQTASATPGSDHGPEQILASRFHRGEIDQTEYHQRLEAVRHTAH